MQDNEAPLELLYRKAENYSKTTLELLQLKAIDKTADVLSGLVAKLTIFIAATLAVLIINIGIALWIGDLLGVYYYGFFVVGGFYIIVALILYLFKDELVKIPINNLIIEQMMKKKVI